MKEILNIFGTWLRKEYQQQFLKGSQYHAPSPLLDMQVCENIENVFFGVEVIIKIKETLVNPVSSAFLDDVSNVQLSHFVQL